MPRVGSLPPPPPPLRKDLPDPELMQRDRGQLAWTHVDGDVFVDGPSAGDVRQGNLDNCYLLAAFAAAAKQKPELLRNAIRDNGDGTFAVRYFEKKLFGAPKEKWIPIDRQLATRFGLIQEYGRASRHDELWVGLFEKAYAASKGGYEKIGNLGKAADAMFALTGKNAPFVRGGDMDDLSRRLSRGELIVAATHDERTVAGTGIKSNHSYAVLGVANGQVQLHDPIDGEVTVSQAVFARAFKGYNAG